MLEWKEHMSDCLSCGRIAKFRYCSRECYDMERIVDVRKSCFVCGKVWSAESWYQKNVKQTCSDECRYKLSFSHSRLKITNSKDEIITILNGSHSIRDAARNLNVSFTALSNYMKANSIQTLKHRRH